MLSLHFFSLFTVVSYFTDFIEFLFYFILLVFLCCTNVFNIYSNKVITYNKILFYFFILFFFFIFFFYIFKFFLCYTGYLYTGSHSSFSNVIILLCIITGFISVIFLSERGLLYRPNNLFYFFIFLLCTVQMVNTTNFFLMLFYFELLFLPSLFFVYSFGYSKKVDITVSFLLKWTFSGSLMVLFAIIYLYLITGVTEFHELGSSSLSIIESNFIFLILFLGFGVKLPVWPFYYWLTKVHVEAPSGFSIFLSGFLVKTAFFCLVSFIPLFKSSYVINLVLVIVLWGCLDSSIRFWTSTDIKRLVAFATIQEMNLMLLLMFYVNEYSLFFINLFLLTHGILSSLLFFLVDQIQKQVSTRNLTALGGLAALSKYITILIWVAILSFRGFPVFVKFIIEWEILISNLITFNYIGFFLFFIISFFGVLGFCRIWFIVLYGSPKLLIFSDILKKDITVAISLIFILFFLNFLVFLF